MLNEMYSSWFWYDGGRDLLLPTYGFLNVNQSQTRASIVNVALLSKVIFGETISQRTNKTYLAGIMENRAKNKVDTHHNRFRTAVKFNYSTVYCF